MGDRTFLISKVLPYCAAMWLVDASRTGKSGSKERIMAIDDAVERCKRHYPEYFGQARCTGGRN